MKKFVLLMSLLVVAVSPAFSQMHHDHMKDCQNCDMHKPSMGGMMGMNGMMEMGGMDHIGEMMGTCLVNAEKIELTADQIKKLTPLHREMQKKHVRFKADMKIAEMEQMEIMEVKDFDLEKASSAVKKISDIKIAHHLDVLKSMKQIRDNLTDDQFGKMKQFMALKKAGEMPVKKIKQKKHRH